MNLQKIHWKLYFKNPGAAKPADFFKVFNTWIPNSPEIFIDVADYQHVHDGPWTLLVGHILDYALDHSDRRLGFLYNRKKPMDGSTAEKLANSLRDFLKACLRLEQDPIFSGKLSLATHELLFLINDRAIAPNTTDTFNAIRPELRTLCDRVYGKGAYTLSHRDPPKQRFSIAIRAKQAPSLAECLNHF